MKLGVVRKIQAKFHIFPKHLGILFKSLKVSTIFVSLEF
jgi:hypothetical protein